MELDVFGMRQNMKEIPGVISTECGYCGGKNPTVSYEQVCGGNTEHIEVVKVEFDPKILSYEKVD